MAGGLLGGGAAYLLPGIMELIGNRFSVASPTRTFDNTVYDRKFIENTYRRSFQNEVPN
jgi:hypothetical protein